ncbi:DNA polymerase III subunit alpha [Ruminococcus sp. CLA-AA-H200]|uniref:DNA-directed DNA polymerase n=1 Tax=Ruminococcus turbiniformis TaxID=2881258 RepID=A0ABS8FX30_9FIRM|nr:DNA polymerase III subunit alpha [Ruminococcus turbiniformis]MCC2254586.1 DNA polymerase III subunit alpha [Ruminococcus turbiniformis]
MFSIIHAHTMYSLHDSAQTPEELVLRAKEIGAVAVSLTDHGTMLGIDDFLEAGKKHGVNTVPGIETYLDHKEHFILIAKDLEGYRQIAKAVRDAEANQSKTGHITYPIMTRETLEKYFKGSQHVIATTACISGPLSQILLSRKKAERALQKRQDKLSSLKEYYEMWKSADAAYKAALKSEREFKRDKNESKKYLTKTFLTQIEKARKKAGNDPESQEAAIRLHELETLNRLAQQDYVAAEEKYQAAVKTRREEKAAADKLRRKAETYKKLDAELKHPRLPEEPKLYEQAKEELYTLKKIFPQLYIELQYHGLPDEAYVMPLLCKLAKETGTPVIAANDAHMAKKGQEQARQILRYNYYMQHQNLQEADKELYVKTEGELRDSLLEILPEDPVEEAIRNTAVLDQCHVEIPMGKHYPKCSSDMDFYQLLEEGKREKFREDEWTGEYEDRLKREVKIIEQMGYVDYHMVVQDYCRMIRLLSCIPQYDLPKMPKDFSKVKEWVKRKGYVSGTYAPPGRGSAAGSLVCYLLGITNVDPIRYHLLFDRYLNPERVSMPDIDTDVKRSLRPYIIKYLKWKYGEKAVTSICTKTSYAGRSAVRMAGRDRASELNVETYPHAEEVASLIPIGSTVSECDALFYQMYGDDEEKTLLWEKAKLIEGKLSAVGVHAGGVVISDNGDVSDYVPVTWRGEKQVWAVQCDMNQIEQKGLLKMDLLGLNTQDCISDTLQLVERYRGEIIDIEKIEFEQEVFREIFSEGNTNSVFQFESDGMKELLKSFKPDTIEDLIILVAMYRPGPMQYIEDVISVKHGKRKPEYLVPELKPILSVTYGAIVYQEQVMQIFRQLAGYSLGQADLVRRAMSKKKEEKLKVEKHAFIYGDPKRGITGCIHNGIAEDAAQKLFEQLTEFAKYAFNKSHAAAYAIVSYQTAWLKYHFPTEFLCAMYNNDEIEKYPGILEDCRRLGISVLGPDINHSFFDFVIEDNAIRYGFCGIKGIASRSDIEQITCLRSRAYTEAPFLSVADFTSRTKEIKPGKRILSALICAGAFDSYTRDREKLFLALDDHTLGSACSETTDCGDKDNNYNESWICEHEIQALGFLLTADPMASYGPEEGYGCTPFKQLKNGHCKVMGILSEIEQKHKKNGMYVTATLYGKDGTAHLLFQTTEKPEKMMAGKAVRLEGNYKDGTVFVSKCSPLEKHTYYLNLDSWQKTEEAKQVIARNGKGTLSLIVVFHFDASAKRIAPTVSELHVNIDTIKELGCINYMHTGITNKKDH